MDRERLAVHGHRALVRALTESRILEMLAISGESANASVAKLASTGFSFVRQNRHLTSDSYDYGIAFIGEAYVRSHWSRLFSVEGITSGGIHDFQDTSSSGDHDVASQIERRGRWV